MGLAHLVKAHIMAPAYRHLAQVAPEQAEQLKSGLKHLWNGTCPPLPKAGVCSKQRRTSSPCLFVDTTQLTIINSGTGIQRVVVSLLLNLSLPGYELVPVQAYQGMVLTSWDNYRRLRTERKSRISRIVKGLGQRARRALHGAEAEREQEISPRQGDILFLLDSSWEYAEEFGRLMADMQAMGCKAYGLVHDFIPWLYAETVQDKLTLEAFASWHAMLLREADGLICNSRATATQAWELLQAHDCHWYEEGLRRQRPCEVHYFPMGADLPVAAPVARQELSSFVAGGRPTFLMAGTVEVRKDHVTVLRALAAVLRAKPDSRMQLLIIGHDGWKNEAVKEMLSEDKVLRQHVLWLRDAGDGELVWAYRNVSALIMASLTEGYGLPVVEAAHFGRPLILSDIPVFHEVSQERAEFFPVGDAEALARLLLTWEEREHPDASGLKLHTWQEAARVVGSILLGCREPYRIYEEAGQA